MTFSVNPNFHQNFVFAVVKKRGIGKKITMRFPQNTAFVWRKNARTSDVSVIQPNFVGKMDVCNHKSQTVKFQFIWNRKRRFYPNVFSFAADNSLQIPRGRSVKRLKIRVYRVKCSVVFVTFRPKKRFSKFNFQDFFILRRAARNTKNR